MADEVLDAVLGRLAKDGRLVEGDPLEAQAGPHGGLERPPMRLIRDPAALDEFAV